MRMTYEEKLNIQRPIIEMMFDAMSAEKKEAFRNAAYRNCYLTSEYTLRNGRIVTYKEGWYLELEGCRSRFAAFAKDNDGELEIIRKPKDEKLHKIWGMEFDNTFIYSGEEYGTVVFQ